MVVIVPVIVMSVPMAVVMPMIVVLVFVPMPVAMFGCHRDAVSFLVEMAAQRINGPPQIRA